MLMRRNFSILIIATICFMIFALVRLREKIKMSRFEINLNNFNATFFEDESNAMPRELPVSLSLNELITLKNEKQEILNENKYGPVTNETILITIQVHNRAKYLSHLINGLRNAKNIEKTLLIFSHDLYDNAINELIQSIDFCKVMQIFYPFSIQLYPDTFPGTDKRDCPRDIEKVEAKNIRCLNHEYADAYGHYREAKFTQMKHHWWWKLNRIFDELRTTRNHKGYLLLLEEDYYVAEDFLYIYKLMQQKIPQKCPDCNVISLGEHTGILNERTFNLMDVAPWETGKHNMGMAFNKTTWNAIRNCAEHFCNYDEYNYDFSLQNINRRCLKDNLFVAVSRGPRIYHVGECGVHHTKTNCDVDGKISSINSDLAVAMSKHFLFPKDIRLGHIDLVDTKRHLTNNGGWADKRDKCLCLRMAAHNNPHRLKCQLTIEE